MYINNLINPIPIAINVISNMDSESVISDVKAKVSEICARLPVYKK